MNKLMWDEKDGLYYDYDFVNKQRSALSVSHNVLSACGQALPSRSRQRGVEKNLSIFEREGGLQTSTHVSGNQWDAPFGWAPLQMIAVDGLRRYGYQDDAKRISVKWLITDTQRLSTARIYCREVRRGAWQLERRIADSLRLQREPGGIRVDECGIHKAVR